MRRIQALHREALHDVAGTRAIERALAARLPPHALMERAGRSVAHLAMALHPHARRLWIVCGPGNNGGDGLIAALRLREWAQRGGRELVVTHDADLQRLPEDAAWARALADAAGLPIAERAPPNADLVIDALLGLGARPLADGPLLHRLAEIESLGAPVLAIDLPSGLDADSGRLARPVVPGPSRHTLSLLTLKPGLFTAHGRDAAGEVWFDDLGADGDLAPAIAWGGGVETALADRAADAHAGHKGSYGDVAVLGGQLPGPQGIAMGGAALLAASGALHAGAGRVFVALVGHGDLPAFDPLLPELMFRTPERLVEAMHESSLTVVAGCGGGDAVAAWLPACLGRAHRLVLDADALNAVARDPALQALLRARAAQGRVTVLTPHPLEAARLLGATTDEVMADRLGLTRELARRYEALVVLKGSGTVVAGPDRPPWINLTGNARLATAGTGDVLAGMVGAALARRRAEAGDAVCSAVAHHGALADAWAPGRTLTASALARLAGPV